MILADDACRLCHHYLATVSPENGRKYVVVFLSEPSAGKRGVLEKFDVFTLPQSTSWYAQTPVHISLQNGLVTNVISKDQVSEQFELDGG